MRSSRRRFVGGAAALTAGACGPSGTGTGPPAARDDPGVRRDEPTPYPFVCGLSFLPDDQADYRAAGLAGMVADVSAGEMRSRPDGVGQYYRSYAKCRASLEDAKALLTADGPAELATHGSDVASAHAQGRTAVFLQFQSAEPFEGETPQGPDRVETLYAMGLRIVQLTHNLDNVFAGGYMEPRPSGLTQRGLELLERLEARRILVDLAHASEATMKDVLAASRGPLVLSHGAARAMVDHPRCTPDPLLRAIGERGGLIGVFMMSFWLTEDPVPTVEHVVRQLRHIENVAGAEAVGLANDYTIAGHRDLAAIGNDNVEGARMYRPWWNEQRERGIEGFGPDPQHVVVPELNDVRRLFTLHEALVDAGLPVAFVERVMGGNWIRVLSEAL